MTKLNEYLQELQDEGIIDYSVKSQIKYLVNTESKENKKQQALAIVLQNTINETDRLFETKEQSHAYIIGYLQGAIKTTIYELGLQN